MYLQKRRYTPITATNENSLKKLLSVSSIPFAQVLTICNNAKFNPIEELYQIKKLMLASLNDEKSSPIFQLEKYYPKIHKTLMERKFEVMQSCVSENLQRGIDEGYFRKDIDISLITRIYFKGVTGIKDPVIFPVETYEVAYVLENYLDYHVRGIATEKGVQTLDQTKIKYNS